MNLVSLFFVLSISPKTQWYRGEGSLVEQVLFQVATDATLGRAHRGLPPPPHRPDRQRAICPPLEFAPGYEEIRTRAARALHKVGKKLEFHII